MQTDSNKLADRPSLAGYWKFNTSLLEIRDFQDRLESLVHRALMVDLLNIRLEISPSRSPAQLRTKVAKSLEDKLSRAGDIARQDLEREASERYKGYVVTSRLRRVTNEAEKCKAFAREKEVRRFPFRYIESVKSPDGCVLDSNHEIRVAFQVHFRDRFARCPDLPVQKFRGYLADFSRPLEAKAACCEGLVTECEVRDALKQIRRLTF